MAITRVGDGAIEVYRHAKTISNNRTPIHRPDYEKLRNTVETVTSELEGVGEVIQPDTMSGLTGGQCDLRLAIILDTTEEAYPKIRKVNEALSQADLNPSFSGQGTHYFMQGRTTKISGGSNHILVDLWSKEGLGKAVSGLPGNVYVSGLREGTSALVEQTMWKCGGRELRVTTGGRRNRELFGFEYAESGMIKDEYAWYDGKSGVYLGFDGFSLLCSKVLLDPSGEVQEQLQQLHKNVQTAIKRKRIKGTFLEAIPDMKRLSMKPATREWIEHLF